MDKDVRDLIEIHLMKQDKTLSELNDRLKKIEESVNMGKGALGMFIAFLGLLGTIASFIKIFGK